ncbi:hypothetical protein Syun_017337 [Stephania yunnanensis]|uniref:Uncharacterized protein n=1 Tax=Stephania yunnanensis TaxID=152371 RepID=A0AAP0J7N0_9MAGN
MAVRFGSCTLAYNPTVRRGMPLMETSREEGKCHKTVDSVEVVAFAVAAIAAVTAAVEVKQSTRLNSWWKNTQNGVFTRSDRMLDSLPRVSIAWWVE